MIITIQISKKVYDDLDTEYREFLYKYLCNNRAMNEKMPEVKNLIVLALPIFAILFSLFSNMISISNSSNAILAQKMVETLLTFGQTATGLLVIAILAYFVDVIVVLIDNRKCDKRKVITEIVSMLHDKEEA